MADKTIDIGRALEDSLISPNEADSNLEPANVVDGLFAIARAIRQTGRVLAATHNIDSEACDLIMRGLYINKGDGDE